MMYVCGGYLMSFDFIDMKHNWLVVFSIEG